MRQVIILMLISISLTLKSQNVEIGALGGVSFYNGDLSPDRESDYFEQLYPAVGLFGRVNFNSHFSGRLSLNYGKVSGTDDNTANQNRGLNFRTNIFELNLTGEVNLFRLGGPNAAVNLVPYLFGGVGYYRFNPEGNQGRGYQELQPLGTEGQGLPGFDDPYSLSQINLPFGAGLKIIINQTWAIGLEVGGRKLFTDYLDDVSDTELVYEVIRQGNGDLAAQFSNPNLRFSEEATQTYTRGGKGEDWYYISGVTLSYFFGPASNYGYRGDVGRCPKF